MCHFRLISEFSPSGQQPGAIQQLCRGIEAGQKHQTLLGVTGSGKTFTVANVIAKLNIPTLVLAHNKTLAGQLYNEFRQLFPDNAVGYFVSYYDYYQPEAYVPQRDLYIEKDSSINDTVDKLRHYATRALFERPDVVIVATVSCIYGLGSPEAYFNMLVLLEIGLTIDRDILLKRLVELQYTRNDIDFHRGTFRVRGDLIELFPPDEEAQAMRISLFGDEIESIQLFDPLTGSTLKSLEKVAIYPNSHYVTPPDRLRAAARSIRLEMDERIHHFKTHGRHLEAQRIEQRTSFDLEMIEEMGFCKGIENYSRHLTGRPPGAPPPTLLDYFPKRFLLVVDESHVTIPQATGMYRGDRARKETLVEYGFRLPSALDNRPLRFDEFEGAQDAVIYVSATPADYELSKSDGRVVEQVVRPTGLLDPVIEVYPASKQVDHLLEQVRVTTRKGMRSLVVTLTKRLAEELTEYLRNLNIRAEYLHSDIDTIERMRLIQKLRRGECDALVGINLLREGLDIPEVALVAILDADKEGFLRSERSLIQTMGRASRNIQGRAILYGDTLTGSMQRAIQETERRRTIQAAYNRVHGVVPKSISKRLETVDESIWEKDYAGLPEEASTVTDDWNKGESSEHLVKRLTEEMHSAAKALDFERAAKIRDRLLQITSLRLMVGLEGEESRTGA